MAVTSTSEEIIEGDDMIDIDTLLDDDALMSMTFDWETACVINQPSALMLLTSAFACKYKL